MNIIEKEFARRKNEIKREIAALFKANMKITDWDIPEADDTQAATILVGIMKEALDEIEQDIKAGKYENY